MADEAQLATPISILSRYPEPKTQGEPTGLSGLFNQAARLKPGHLLVVHLATNACFQVDPESGQPEYLFTISHEQTPFLWRVLASPEGEIYCTLSGVRRQDSPTKDAAFGLAGAVVRLNTRLAEIDVVSAGSELADPCGMQILDETRLLVCDFSGFGGTGSVYTVDRLTGEVERLAEGGLLADPVSAYRDENGTIWVANSYMHYTYGHRGGVIEKDDGEVLAITPDGRQRVVVPRESPATGSIVGIHGAHDPAYVIAVKGDWPVMETGAVLLIEKKSGAIEVLLSASPDEPRFYSTHVGVDGHILWVGESYRKELLGYDLANRKVVHRFDLSGVMGRWHGVASSFEGIESVSVVPRKSKA